jgi:hypothetical protein
MSEEKLSPFESDERHSGHTPTDTEIRCRHCPDSPPFASQKEFKDHWQYSHECEFCGRSFRHEWERENHIRQDHGKKLNYEITAFDMEVLDRWVDDPDVSPKTPRTCGTVPNRVDQRRRWLHAACVALVEASDPEQWLEKCGEEFKPQAAYVLENFPRLRTTFGLARYKRLRTKEARARVLAASLADLVHAPSYAAQLYEKMIAAKRRELRSGT